MNILKIKRNNMKTILMIIGTILVLGITSCKKKDIDPSTKVESIDSTKKSNGVKVYPK
jgi:hypothetical protein